MVIDTLRNLRLSAEELCKNPNNHAPSLVSRIVRDLIKEIDRSQNCCEKYGTKTMRQEAAIVRMVLRNKKTRELYAKLLKIAIMDRVKIMEMRPDPTGMNRKKLPLSEESCQDLARMEIDLEMGRSLNNEYFQFLNEVKGPQKPFASEFIYNSIKEARELCQKNWWTEFKEKVPQRDVERGYTLVPVLLSFIDQQDRQIKSQESEIKSWTDTSRLYAERARRYKALIRENAKKADKE
jgi:hypothetical protein